MERNTVVAAVVEVLVPRYARNGPNDNNQNSNADFLPEGKNAHQK